jgi:hypothetical protein
MSLASLLEIKPQRFLDDRRAPSQARVVLQAVKLRDQFAGQIGLHKNPSLRAPTRPKVSDTFQLNLFSGATRHVYMKRRNRPILQPFA